MRLIKCSLSTLMTSSGSGSRLLFFCFVLVVSFFPQGSYAGGKAYLGYSGSKNVFSDVSTACAAAVVNFPLIGISSGSSNPNQFMCLGKIGSQTGSIGTVIFVPDANCGNDCVPPERKCASLYGVTQTHSWEQSSDSVPKTIDANGCQLVTSGVGACFQQSGGQYRCTSDVSPNGLLTPPSEPQEPIPDDPGDGGSSGGGSSGGGSSGGGSSGGGSSGGGSSGGGSGSGDGGGNGNGDGDGTCEGDDCGEDDAQVSGDMQCDTVVSCTGDVIQCAVLRQEQQSRCADKEWRDISDKKIADLKSSLENEFSGQEYQPIKPTADTTFDLSSMIDTSSRFGASCPVLPVISVPFVNGTSFSFNPNIDGLCTFLTYMGYLMVAFAMRRAAEIIATGV